MSLAKKKRNRKVWEGGLDKMANVIEYFASDLFDIAKLQELADDLDGILSEIALDGKSEDFDYIKQQQKEMEEKYGEYVARLCAHIKGVQKEEGLTKAVDCILDAYATLQEFNFERPWYIQEDALNSLYENLLFPDRDCVVVSADEELIDEN